MFRNYLWNEISFTCFHQLTQKREFSKILSLLLSLIYVEKNILSIRSQKKKNMELLPCDIDATFEKIKC